MIKILIITILGIVLSHGIVAQSKTIVRVEIAAIPFMTIKRMAVTEKTLALQSNYIHFSVPATDSLKNTVAYLNVLNDTTTFHKGDIRVIFKLYFSDSTSKKIIFYQSCKYIYQNKLFNRNDCIVKFFMNLLPEKYRIHKSVKLRCNENI